MVVFGLKVVYTAGYGKCVVGDQVYAKGGWVGKRGDAGEEVGS